MKLDKRNEITGSSTPTLKKTDFAKAVPVLVRFITNCVIIKRDCSIWCVCLCSVLCVSECACERRKSF